MYDSKYRQENITEAVPKPGFTEVKNLAFLLLIFALIDLETTELIQRRLIPHITLRTTAQDFAIEEKFSGYVKRLIPITAESQKVMGIYVMELNNSEGFTCISFFSSWRGPLKFSRNFDSLHWQNV